MPPVPLLSFFGTVTTKAVVILQLAMKSEEFSHSDITLISSFILFTYILSSLCTHS